jgi:hypothetical protein
MNILDQTHILRREIYSCFYYLSRKGRGNLERIVESGEKRIVRNTNSIAESGEKRIVRKINN